MLRSKLMTTIYDSGGGGVDYDPLGDDFVIVVDTTLPGASKTVEIPFNGSHSVTVDWGDGTTETLSGFGDITHTYASDGEYTVAVSGTAYRWAYGDRYAWKECLAVGKIVYASIDRQFARAYNMTSAPNIIPSGLGKADYAFADCSSLTSGLVGWDVSSCSSMYSMLSGTTVFDQDLSGWCVQNILSEPINFAANSALSAAHKPVWGTCPS